MEFTHNLKIEKVSERFESTWPIVVEALCSRNGHNDIPLIKTHLRKLLQYNVPHGKGFRGMSAVFSYICMVEDFSEESLELACIFGWAIELLQASFLVADDIMDSSETRRGNVCWYKMESVGLCAINDAFMLENAAYSLLRKYFENQSYYANLISMIHDVVFKTTLGQSLDTQTSIECDFSTFTMERYSSICKYKTGYYSFYLPVVGALLMSGKNVDVKNMQEVENILLEIGLFFQIQDDYLDVFGDSDITGKIGTDIVEGKCSWLIVKALAKATQDEKQLLKEMYKKGEKESEVVKDVFRRMNLEEDFMKLENQVYHKMQESINNLDKHIPQKPFAYLLKFISNRQK